MSRSNLHIRMDSEVKDKFKALCKERNFEMGIVIEVFASRWVSQTERFNKIVKEYERKSAT
jgi:antitoxin component of RelBE/YafQ-DinJ toxin-antitoxin module